ncbi:hypothetical protein CONPUDRAFT_156276, partial [Coniophora puteana RWD-64-598 SS2]
EEFQGDPGALLEIDDDDEIEQRFSRALAAIEEVAGGGGHIQLRKVLQSTQGEIQELRDEYRTVKKQNNVLYALLPANKRRDFDRGLSLETIIYQSKFLSLGRLFPLLIRPWVKEGSIPPSPLARDVDPASPDRWTNSQSEVLAAMADVYRFLSDDPLRDLIEQDPELGTEFIKGVNLARRGYMGELRKYRSTIFPGPLTAERKQRLLKRSVKSKKYSRYAPVLYPDPDALHEPDFLKSMPVVDTLIIKLFGFSGLSIHCKPRPKGKSKGASVTKITPEMVATAAIDVRYLLTDDPEYVTPGAPSGIPYASDRDELLKLLYTADPKWGNDVMEFYDYQILGIPPKSTSSDTDKQGGATAADEEDEEVAFLAGLNQHYNEAGTSSPTDPSTGDPASAEVNTLAQQIGALGLSPHRTGPNLDQEPGNIAVDPAQRLSSASSRRTSQQYMSASPKSISAAAQVANTPPSLGDQTDDTTDSDGGETIEAVSHVAQVKGRALTRAPAHALIGSAGPVSRSQSLSHGAISANTAAAQVQAARGRASTLSVSARFILASTTRDALSTLLHPFRPFSISQGLLNTLACSRHPLPSTPSPASLNALARFPQRPRPLPSTPSTASLNALARSPQRPRPLPSTPSPAPLMFSSTSWGFPSLLIVL